MKTINKFTAQSAEIKMQMTSEKDADFFKGTYKIIETPRKKNSEWHEEIAYYNYSDDAKKDFINRINFWLR